MAQFEKLQDLWQRQSVAPALEVDAERLARSVQAYARRQAYVNVAKALVIAIVLAWSFSRVPATPRVVAGLAIVALAAGVMLVREWRMQRAIARLEFGAPSLGFVRSTMDRLYRQHDAHQRLYWPFIGSMVLGLNLILSSTARLWERALLSGLPFFAFELGMWLRRKRFEMECRPLIERLSAMRSSLEERAE